MTRDFYDGDIERNELSAAATDGNLPYCERAVKRGVSPHGRPLESACINGFHDIVKLFLDAGAVPDRTCVREAIIGNFVEVVRLVVNNKPSAATGMLYVAAERGFYDICEVLLQHGDDVNGISGRLRSPIVMAADKGHCLTVDLLIDHGASDLTQAFQVAASVPNVFASNYMAICKRFVDAGVDPMNVSLNMTTFDKIRFLCELIPPNELKRRLCETVDMESIRKVSES